MFSHVYNLAPIDTSISNLAPGHGTILKTLPAEKDIIRDILAPVVTITHPSPNETAWFGTTGTPISFSATVRCLWGAANRASAKIATQKNSDMFAGTSIIGNNADTLALDGIVNLPTSIGGSQATFYIDAGGNTCQYPEHTNLFTPPTNGDYFGGETAGIPLSLNGGKIAVGTGGQVYAGKPVAGAIAGSSLDYAQYNQGSGSNSIQDIAWSHDGTHLAYLIQTNISYGMEYDCHQCRSLYGLVIAYSAKAVNRQSPQCSRYYMECDR